MSHKYVYLSKKMLYLGIRDNGCGVTGRLLDEHDLGPAVHVQEGLRRQILALALGAQPAVEGDSDDEDGEEDDGRDGEADEPKVN